ncbi:hypothetical protein cand_010150 [Cryptosporidium andersoni]|uniref:Histone-binding protein RBBP4-like N-terminal domain-containing protein n=1 Tax=Cryptosporidium andersoni TaxID=117008 RepID=A0A1J4MF67_9CRYT|nr:hypothetical protein cand_010150 [Cryptosporidium andersoni]
MNNQPIIKEQWLWRKCIPFLYDFLMITPLKWPTLTIDIPEITFSIDESYNNNNNIESSNTSIIYPIIYGTYSAGANNEGKTESIHISSVELPHPDVDLLQDNNTKTNEIKYSNPDIIPIYEISVPKEAIRIQSKVNKFNGTFDNEYICIATKLMNGSIYIYKCYIDLIKSKTMENKKNENIITNKLSNKINDNDNDNNNNHHHTSLIPDIIFSDHSYTGYGLQWGVTNSSWLLSGNEDSSIFIYDIANNNNSIISCNNNLNQYSINDVQWLNPILAPTLFLSANHNGYLTLYDTRISNLDNSETYISKYSQVCNKWKISDLPCMSLSVNPSISHLIAIGSYDKNIYTIDLRHISNNKNCSSINHQGILNTLTFHDDIVHRVEWHPDGNSLLLSASLDRKICIWDITKQSNLPIWEQLDNNGINNKSSDKISSTLRHIIGGIRTLPNKNEKQYGPSELLGIHSGHSGIVTDCHWLYSPNNTTWTVASTDILNSLHIWSFNESAFTSENDLIELLYLQQECKITNNNNELFNTLESFQELINK